ncbi:MAG: glycosyltransferase family 4 protein [Geodermatophilaceae bacterium]|nr:glycosyltransferase family 4 protein [Geodermatophilaceae bacterium]
MAAGSERGPRTLIVTNDFPPRTGGIQTYVYALASRLPADSIVVYASDHPGAAEYDAAAPFPVIRDRSRVLLPTAGVGRRAADIARSEVCTTVWYGAAAPLGLLTPGLRRAGVTRFVASTHGHETGWAVLPAARSLLRRISRDVDVLTHITEFTKRGLAPALAPGTDLVWLPPGVDTDLFHPGVDGAGVRAALGLAARPTVVCVSRLVRRKGQDALITALPLLRKTVPDVALLLVGAGPDRARLQRLAERSGVAAAVRFCGAVPWTELPSYYAAGDVFAMPCRTRRGGLDVEGLGMVYLEASALGLPVVAGNSGGAPEAVQDGRTGYVVHDPQSAPAIARRLLPLLTDPGLAARLGAAGRDWVEREWRWDLLADRLAGLLSGRTAR